MCDSVDEFFGIDPTCSSSDENRRRNKLRKGVWSSTDATWAEGIVERYNRIAVPLLREAGSDVAVITDTPIRIPKIIHFIWLGSRPIPRHFKAEEGGIDTRSDTNTDIQGWNECMRSWLKHHPPSSGWIIRLWTEMEVRSSFFDDSSECTSTMTNQAAYDYALSKQNYGLASDILRLELLSSFGGVYVDIDYLCMSPLDDLHSAAAFYCGASNVGCVEINNGLLGCAVRHKVVQLMIEDIGKWFEKKMEQGESETAVPPVAASVFLSSFLDTETTQSLTRAKELTHEDVIRHTGPGLITRMMMAVLVDVADVGDEEDNEGMDRVMVLPAQYFHSLPNDSRADVGEYEAADAFSKKICRNDTTRAVHLWGCSWQN